MPLTCWISRVYFTSGGRAHSLLHAVSCRELAKRICCLHQKSRSKVVSHVIPCSCQCHRELAPRPGARAKDSLNESSAKLKSKYTEMFVIRKVDGFQKATADRILTLNKNN